MIPAMKQSVAMPPRCSGPRAHASHGACFAVSAVPVSPAIARSA